MINKFNELLLSLNNKFKLLIYSLSEVGFNMFLINHTLIYHLLLFDVIIILYPYHCYHQENKG